MDRRTVRALREFPHLRIEIWGTRTRPLIEAGCLREPFGEALSHILVDKGSESLAGSGEGLHGLHFLLSGFRVVVAVAVPVLELDIDVVVSGLECDDAGGSAQVSVRPHICSMRIGREKDSGFSIAPFSVDTLSGGKDDGRGLQVTAFRQVILS